MESYLEVGIKLPKLSSLGQMNPSDGYWVHHRWLRDYEGDNSSMSNFRVYLVARKPLSLIGICLAQILASQWRLACLLLGRPQGTPAIQIHKSKAQNNNFCYTHWKQTKFALIGSSPMHLTDMLRLQNPLDVQARERATWLPAYLLVRVGTR